MIKELILTIGAPGSGKSTWAESYCKSNQKTIILNRDDMRDMLFGGNYKFSRENESIVTKLLMTTLESLLSDNHTKTIIIADTNLNESTRKSIKIIFDKIKNELSTDDLEYVYKEQQFDIPLHELIKRNKTRGKKSVPEDVIRSMYKKMNEYLGKQYVYTPDQSMPKAVIFDLDGTLADNNHRGAFDYDKLINDKPIEEVVHTLKMYLRDGYRIILMSGRNAGNKTDHKKYENLTKEWLKKHNIPWHQLLMREWNDFRKDDIIKEELFKSIDGAYNFKVAYDDRNIVVDMWRRIGLKCFQVNYGDF